MRKNYTFACVVECFLSKSKMKKVFLSIVIACMAFAFSSCKDSDEARCWKVTYKNAGIEVVSYVWLSEDDVKATYGKFDSFTASKVAGSQTDCADLQAEKGGGSIKF